MSQKTRMMWIDTDSGAIGESSVAALPSLLDARDLLVVNDAATLPALLPVRLRDGTPLEVRLLEAPEGALTRAVLFGPGDHRERTEDRAPPPRLAPKSVLLLGALELEIARVSPLSPRLVWLRFHADRRARFAELYRSGRPVQYSYVDEPLALWDVQTVFAARPWAVEMPSAARPLSGATLLALRARGIEVAPLTHAAGLSATGDPRLDAALPLPERYEIPSATVHAIEAAKVRGGRVVAVGTTVVRALEDCAARGGRVRAGVRLAELVLDGGHEPQVVSGLLTGIHMPGESHYRLLSAFADPATLARAAVTAARDGYRSHEFGDAALYLPALGQRQRDAA